MSLRTIKGDSVFYSKMVKEKGFKNKVEKFFVSNFVAFAEESGVLYYILENGEKVTRNQIINIKEKE